MLKTIDYCCQFINYTLDDVLKQIKNCKIENAEIEDDKIVVHGEGYSVYVTKTKVTNCYALERYEECSKCTEACQFVLDSFNEIPYQKGEN